MKTTAIVVLGLLLGGWLLFDGSRALVVGDYVTPSSGRFAGQLGPWSSLFEAIGVSPRSFAVKALHVVVGAAWLVGLGGLVFGAGWARPVLFASAVASLWYLPFGTLIALVVGVLLLLTRPEPAPA